MILKIQLKQDLTSSLKNTTHLLSIVYKKIKLLIIFVNKILKLVLII